MTLLRGHHLQSSLDRFQKHPEYKQILGALLKYEIHSLLQRLAETGEESVVVTTRVTDGAQALIGSTQGEKFIQEPGNNDMVIDNFRKHFLQFCKVSPVDVPSRLKRSHQESGCLSTVLPQTVTPSKKTRQDDKLQNHKSHKKFSQSDSTSCGIRAITVKPDTTECSRTFSNQPPATQFVGIQAHDESDVEKTVSQLVQNIMKQSEEKEKQMTRRRRQRHSHLYVLVKPTDGRPSVSGTDESNVQCSFPSGAVPVSCEKSFQSSNRDEVIIKSEPEDSYDYVFTAQEELTHVSDNTLEHDNGKVSLHSKAGYQQEEELEQIDRDRESVRCENMNGDQGQQQEDYATTNGDGVDFPVVKTEPVSDDDVELPFVEEYYQTQGEVDNLQLKTEERSVQELPDGCYKASERRPGKFNLIHRGYSYVKDKLGKGGTVYWKCGQFQCKGRVIQRGMEKIRTKDHNHSPKLEFDVDP